MGNWIYALFGFSFLFAANTLLFFMKRVNFVQLLHQKQSWKII